MSYEEWNAEASREVKKGVLMTMSYIIERRTKNGMDYYTSQQLDDLKDCAEILHKLGNLEPHHAAPSGHMAGVAMRTSA